MNRDDSTLESGQRPKSKSRRGFADEPKIQVPQKKMDTLRFGGGVPKMFGGKEQGGAGVFAYSVVDRNQ